MKVYQLIKLLKEVDENLNLRIMDQDQSCYEIDNIMITIVFDQIVKKKNFITKECLINVL